MAWDASFKNILKKMLQSSDVEIITETDVPTANLRIDFIIKHENPEKKLIPPFHEANKLIIGEFKSERDKFSLDDINKLLAKSYLFLNTETYNFSEVSSYIMVGGRSSIPKPIEDQFEIRQVSDGIYALDSHFDLRIILIDKLQLDPSNFFLGLFAGKTKREEILRKLLHEQENVIISVAYFLYRDEVIELAESEQVDLDSISKSIRSAVESIGLGRVIKEVGLSRVIEEVGLSRVIEEVGLGRVIEEVGLSRVINEVKLSDLIDNLDNKQKEELLELLKKNKKV